MIVVDLHVHTHNSDGSMALADIPAAAERAGVRAVCVTDHDRLDPALATPVAHLDGVTVVHGIELRVDAGAFRVDLLGYGARRTDALVREVERLQVDRVERARAIVKCVEDPLGADLDIDIGPGVGRPHVARAIEQEPGAPRVRRRLRGGHRRGRPLLRRPRDPRLRDRGGGPLGGVRARRTGPPVPVPRPRDRTRALLGPANRRRRAVVPVRLRGGPPAHRARHRSVRSRPDGRVRRPRRRTRAGLDRAAYRRFRDEVTL